MKKTTCSFLLLAVTSSAAVEVAFDDERWSFDAETAQVVSHLGEQALRLRNGRALLPDVDLKNGVVEFDISFGPERGFSGAMFRFERPGDFENFYFRPHQSGNPDASQYTPEINGVSGWQLYHGPEYAAPFVYRFHEWMPVKIVFSGDRALVRLGEQTLLIPELKRPIDAGAIGLRAGPSPAHFANFRFSETVPEDFAAQDFEVIEVNETPGLVREWRVSEAFPTQRRPELTLDSDLRDRFEWTTVDVGPEGFVNLAVAEGVGADRRAVLAEFDVDASGRQTRLLRFGYSDMARVFVNGTEVYRGDNRYRTRDYRYLGTIGLFDAVPMRLRPGRNVITFAVAEEFGGWGVMAVVEPVNRSGAAATAAASDDDSGMAAFDRSAARSGETGLPAN